MRFERGKKRVEHVRIYAIVPNDLKNARYHPLLSTKLSMQKNRTKYDYVCGLEEMNGSTHLADLELCGLLDVGIMIEGGGEEI